MSGQVARQAAISSRVLAPAAGRAKLAGYLYQREPEPGSLAVHVTHDVAVHRVADQLLEPAGIAGHHLARGA